MGEGSDGRGLSRYLNDHQKELAELRRDVGLLDHGIDKRRLVAFRAFTPSATMTTSDDAHFVASGNAPPPTAEAVRFCYGFVVETALDLQTRQREVDGLMESVRAGRHWRRGEFIGTMACSSEVTTKDFDLGGTRWLAELLSAPAF